MSFNTLNKWALGIADTLALGLLTEGLDLGIPIAALPVGSWGARRNCSCSACWSGR